MYRQDHSGATIAMGMTENLKTETNKQDAIRKFIKVGVQCPTSSADNIPTLFECTLEHEMIQRIRDLAGFVSVAGVCCVEDFCGIGTWFSDCHNDVAAYEVEVGMLHVLREDFWFSCHPVGSPDVTLRTKAISIDEFYSLFAYVDL